MTTTTAPLPAYSSALQLLIEADGRPLRIGGGHTVFTLAADLADLGLLVRAPGGWWRTTERGIRLSSNAGGVVGFKMQLEALCREALETRLPDKFATRKLRNAAERADKSRRLSAQRLIRRNARNEREPSQ